jgi:hypothetical protein
MGSERHTERAFVPSVCLDGVAVPCRAARKRKLAVPAADTAARNPAPVRGQALDAPRRPAPVQAEPDGPAQRPVVQADGEASTRVAGPAGSLAFLAAFEELRAAFELRSRRPEAARAAAAP